MHSKNSMPRVKLSSYRNLDVDYYGCKNKTVDRNGRKGSGLIQNKGVDDIVCQSWWHTERFS